jgi:hypothetical protein
MRGLHVAASLSIGYGHCGDNKMAAPDGSGKSNLITLAKALCAFFGISVLLLAATHTMDTLLTLWPFAERVEDELTVRQQQQLSLYSSLNEHLITLATIVMAFAGGLFGMTTDIKTKLAPSAIAIIWISILFSGISMYAGYSSHRSVIWMLVNQFFNLDNPHVYWPRVVQFYSFLLAVAAVVTVLFLINRNRSSE